MTMTRGNINNNNNNAIVNLFSAASCRTTTTTSMSSSSNSNSSSGGISCSSSDNSRSITAEEDYDIPVNADEDAAGASSLSAGGTKFFSFERYGSKVKEVLVAASILHQGRN
jgi:hypothetical protein